MSLTEKKNMHQQGTEESEVTIITRLGQSWTEDEMLRLTERIGPVSPTPRTHDRELMIPGAHGALKIFNVVGHWWFDRRTIPRSEAPYFPSSNPPVSQDVLDTRTA